jgi:hypothetical protein
MANTTHFFDAVEARHTFYQLENKSPISDERIEEIVNFAVKHCPSAFNVQSARAVVLLREQHEKLWDIGDAAVKRTLPEGAYQYLAPRIKGFRDAYGTVLWFEDDAALEVLQKKNPMIAGMVPEWSHHSTGLHQFTVWTAFVAEGLGANLQHYNFSPDFTKEVRETWKLPETWQLRAQLVFGTPIGGPNERTYLPLEDRVKVF